MPIISACHRPQATSSNLNHTSEIAVNYIENEDMWCFIENGDTIDFFIELRELRGRRKLGGKIDTGKTSQVAIAIRYENSAGLGGLFTHSEDNDADSLVVRDELPPTRDFKVIDSRKQLHLLDEFIDSLSRKYNPLSLAYIDWQMSGATDAIVKISNDYYNYENPDVYSTLRNMLEESELSHELDSVLSKHRFCISDTNIVEGIYYSIPIPESVTKTIDISGDSQEILYFYATFSIDKCLYK